MAQFTRTKHGTLVNLDHIARVKFNGRDGYSLLDRNGEPLGEVEDGEDTTLSLTIIPAAAGVFATVVSCDFHRSERPTEDDIWADRVPVVAWSIEISGMNHTATPITAGAVADEDHVLIEWPDGKLDETHNAIYENLDKAKASILRHAQNQWDISKRLKEEKAASSSRPAKSTE